MVLDIWSGSWRVPEAWHVWETSKGDTLVVVEVKPSYSREPSILKIPVPWGDHHMVCADFKWCTLFRYDVWFIILFHRYLIYEDLTMHLFIITYCIKYFL